MINDEVNYMYPQQCSELAIHKSSGVNASEEKLCRLGYRTFLSLWSYPNLFQKHKLVKELCDLLVVFENHIIIFSDKDCAFGNSGDIKTDWIRWYKKSVLASAKQLCGAKSWIKKCPDRICIDEKGETDFPLKIEINDKTEFHLIAIAHGASDACKKYFGGGDGGLIITNDKPLDIKDRDHCEPFRIGRVLPEEDTFIHVFDDSSYAIVLEEVDTIKDFINYFSDKEQLFLSNVAVSATSENELLAHHIAGLIDGSTTALFDLTHEHGKVGSILMEEGLWEELVDSPKYREWKQQLAISYFWDSLLQKTFYFIENGLFQLGLNVYLSVNLAWEREQLGTANAMMSMSFADKKKPNDVLDYYLYIRDFLEFVNFQKNIPLERIEIFEKSETGKYERRGKVVIFQADSSEYKPSALKSITFPDITSECFPILFGQIAEKRLNNNLNPFFYPSCRREDRTVDAAKWLNTAICFEGEFNTAFPEYRATHDALFHDAKTLLLDAINSAVQKSGKSINNKQNNALKSFKSLIDHADTTIKQKFEVCEVNYEYEMSEAIQRISSMCQVPNDMALADVYASYRNQTAHGVIRRPENCDIATYRILRGFVYVMNLKRANIPADRIKDIIGRMF